MNLLISSVRLCSIAVVCTIAAVVGADAARGGASPERSSSPTAVPLFQPTAPAVQSTVPQHLAVRMPRDSYLPNTVIIKTRNRFLLAPDTRGFPSAALTQGLAPLDVQSVRAPFADFAAAVQPADDPHGVGRIYEVHYATAVDVYDACLALSRNPDVEYAVPMYNRYPSYTPNDPLLPQQYALQKLEAEAAWDVSKGSRDVLIAIVDTGVDYEHEDLAGNLWTNPGEIAGNGRDDDNNGKIDDVRGWDFVGNRTAQQIANGQYQEDNDPKIRVPNLSAFDVRSHGTTVAGAVAAVTDNNKGVAGIAFNCRYVPVKCGSDDVSARGVYRGYEAILYAARLGADVINCSWGGVGGSPAELDIIRQVTDMGSLVVAAAGNETMFTDTPPMAHYPSSYLQVLSVGATQQGDLLAGFSNFGARTTIYAPGESIMSTIPDNRYAGTSGTSIAAPIVAGVAALVRAVHPDWTPRQILQQIRSTADNVMVNSTPNNRYLLYGRINARRALQYNRSFLATLRTPGISSTAVDILPDAAENRLTTLEPTPVKLTLKNYLAPASDLQVSVRSLDAFVTLPATTTFSLGSLATLAEKSLTLSVQLAAMTPWSDGTVDILVTYKSGDYEDFERISLPVALPSGGNTAVNVQYPLSPIDVDWQDMSSPSPSVNWAVGFREGIGYFLSSAIGFPLEFVARPAFAVEARSASVAYAAVSNARGGNAEIMKTTNGGLGWTSTPVNSITPFINAIYFFDDNTGLFLGDPLGTRWGVGRTTNAGQSWTAVTTLPDAGTGEAGLVGCACRLGDRVWFGTTRGRVFATDDRGATWTVTTPVPQAVITAVSFATPARGMVLYRTGDDSSLPILVASTADSGRTWTPNVFNFSSIGFTPVDLYSPPGSMQTVVVGAGSEMLASIDNGATWVPHRTGYRGATAQAAGAVAGGTMRIWTVGAAYGYTESSIPRERILSADVSSLTFGAVTIGSTATRSVVLSNTGIQPLTVSAIEVSGGSAAAEYSVPAMPVLPRVLQPNEILTVDVEFAPAKGGVRSSTLRVTSNADPAVVTVSLSGLGQTPTVDVAEPLSVSGVGHYPQPAAEHLTVAFDLAVAGVVRMDVVDVHGAAVWSAETARQSGRVTIAVPTGGLASGVYFYRLRTPGGAELARPFIVQH